MLSASTSSDLCLCSTWGNKKCTFDGAPTDRHALLENTNDRGLYNDHFLYVN